MAECTAATVFPSMIMILIIYGFPLTVCRYSGIPAEMCQIHIRVKRLQIFQVMILSQFKFTIQQRDLVQLKRRIHFIFYRIY